MGLFCCRSHVVASASPQGLQRAPSCRVSCSTKWLLSYAKAGASRKWKLPVHLKAVPRTKARLLPPSPTGLSRPTASRPQAWRNRAPPMQSEREGRLCKAASAASLLALSGWERQNQCVATSFRQTHATPFPRGQGLGANTGHLDKHNAQMSGLHITNGCTQVDHLTASR